MSQCFLSIKWKSTVINTVWLPTFFKILILWEYILKMDECHIYIYSHVKFDWRVETCSHSIQSYISSFLSDKAIIAAYRLLLQWRFGGLRPDSFSLYGKEQRQHSAKLHFLHSPEKKRTWFETTWVKLMLTEFSFSLNYSFKKWCYVLVWA